MKNEEQPMWRMVHSETSCGDLNLIQTKCYQTNNSKELFSKVEPFKIIQFLKETILYMKI